MEATQARQKSYSDRRRRPVKFEVGDFVYLKVSPMKGVNHFGVKRKLAPRYVGPYQIIEKSGKVAYRVQLPPEMRAIFTVFHVSQLNKFLRVPEERVETGGLKLQTDLSYEEKPVQVLDVKERVTRGRVIKLFRVLWNDQSERDAAWEREDYLQVTYPSFYEKWYVFQILGRDFLKGGRAVTLLVLACMLTLSIAST